MVAMVAVTHCHCFLSQVKTIVVPTDDAKVKAILREYREPICKYNTYRVTRKFGGYYNYLANEPFEPTRRFNLVFQVWLLQQ